MLISSEGFQLNLTFVRNEISRYIIFLYISYKVIIVVLKSNSLIWNYQENDSQLLRWYYLVKISN